MTEHRADIPQTLFLIVQETMFDAGAYTARRTFRAQCQAIAVAILKGVHLFSTTSVTSPIARLNNGVCSTIGKRISL